MLNYMKALSQKQENAAFFMKTLSSEFYCHLVVSDIHTACVLEHIVQFPQGGLSIR